MFGKNQYFIKTQKSASFIRHKGKTVQIDCSGTEESPILKFESQISDFLLYENQLRSGLKELGYKSKSLRKNILYFSIPSDADPVLKRSYFVAGWEVDASEIRLMDENKAILINPDFDNVRNKSVLIIGFFESKFEFSIIQNLEIKYNRSFVFSSALFQLSWSEKLLDELAQLKRSHQVDKTLLINDRNDNFYEILIGHSHFEIVKDRDEMILSGLEIAAQTNSEKLMNQKRI